MNILPSEYIIFLAPLMDIQVLSELETTWDSFCFRLVLQVCSCFPWASQLPWVKYFLSPIVSGLLKVTLSCCWREQSCFLEEELVANMTQSLSEGLSVSKLSSISLSTRFFSCFHYQNSWNAVSTTVKLVPTVVLATNNYFTMPQKTYLTVKELKKK